MTITELDLPTKINEILNTHAEGIKKAIEVDAKTNSQLQTSKAVAACKMAIRNEINRQGKIYTDEENEVTAHIKKLHEACKSSAKNCELIVEGLKKTWADNKAKDLSLTVQGLGNVVKEAKQIKSDMKKHQAFRGGFCQQKLLLKVLSGERTDGNFVKAAERDYNELNTLYLGIREPPMKDYMALFDKWQKIEEFHKRGEHFLALLPAIKKEEQQDKEAILKTLKADAAEFEKLQNDEKNGFGKISPQRTDILERTRKSLEKPTPEILKNSQSSLANADGMIKAYRSQLKTATMKEQGIFKKAGSLAQEQEVKEIAKKMQEYVKAWGKLIETYLKKYEETKKAYEKASKKK